MLPVPHQACTLATGALRSSFTIRVKPSGKTHFLAVFGGNVMTADGSAGAAFRLTMAKTNAETRIVTRYTTLFDSQSDAPFDQEIFGSGNPGGNFCGVVVDSGAYGFTNASWK